MLQSVESSATEATQLGLQYRVFLPPEESAFSDTGVLMVHGRAGNFEVMWTFSKMLEKFKPVVIAPQAFVPDPNDGGWSWWTVGKEKVLADEVDSSVARLEEFIKHATQKYSLDPKKLIAVGFSQGAGMISALSLKNPELFQACALLAGFVPRHIVEAPYSANKPLPKYLVLHGSEDEIVPLKIAERARDFLSGAGAEVEMHVDKVGHKVGAQGMKILGAWLDGHLSALNSKA